MQYFHKGSLTKHLKRHHLIEQGHDQQKDLKEEEEMKGVSTSTYIGSNISDSNHMEILRMFEEE